MNRRCRECGAPVIARGDRSIATCLSWCRRQARRQAIRLTAPIDLSHFRRNPVTAATDIDVGRRTDRRPCPNCEGSAAGCASVEWLGGRLCCDTCTGNHDQATRDATP